jgi:hypothetical protein
LGSADAVLEQLPRRIADDHGVAPHSAFDFRAPPEFRQRRQAMVTG